MIKLLKVDTSGKVPCPNSHNPDLSRLRGLKIQGGFVLAGHFPALTLRLTDGEESPTGLVDFFQTGLLHVVSHRLRNVLEGAGAEVEYFPVNVIYKGGSSSVEYFVANPLKRFMAVDIENSEVELDEEIGNAVMVDKLVIDPVKFGSAKLAVIAEIQKVGVQSEVALAIESSGCTGCVFVDPISVRF